MTAFDKIANLHEFCEALHKHMEQARKTIDDETFDELMSGPLQDVLCGVMDLEDAWMQCEVS
jgi:energy-converting hydrogenase A subunit M